MFFKVLILSIILVAFTMLALGIKLLFNKDATITGHSCSLEQGKLNEPGDCAACEIKDVANCAEKEK